MRKRIETAAAGLVHGHRDVRLLAVLAAGFVRSTELVLRDVFPWPVIGFDSLTVTFPEPPVSASL
jgi:hypothetical protein